MITMYTYANVQPVYFALNLLVFENQLFIYCFMRGNPQLLNQLMLG